MKASRVGAIGSKSHALSTVNCDDSATHRDQNFITPHQAATTAVVVVVLSVWDGICFRPQLRPRFITFNCRICAQRVCISD